MTTPRSRLLRCRTGLLVAGVAVLAASGCGATTPAGGEDRTTAYTSSPGADTTTGPVTAVEFAVRDFSLRARDSACAGARPFLGLRPGARVVVTGTGGAERATGTLREGRAIKATDIDFETAKREPTFCKFALVLSPQLPPGTYTFTAGDGRTAPLTEGESAGSVAVSFPSVGSPEDVLGPPPGSTPSVTP